MTVLTETTHAGGFLVSAANKTRSCDVVIIASGENLSAGTVLGKITSSGKYVELAPGASDGSENAAAILWDHVDATGGDQRGTAVVRDAEVNLDEAVWPDGITDQQKATAETKLAALGIVNRDAGEVKVTIGATTLVFSQVPAGGDAGTDLGAVEVRIENDQGTLISGDNSTEVTLAKNSGSGALTVTGGAAVTAVGGIATFPGISFDAADTYTLIATASGVTDAISDEIEVAAV